MVARQRRTQEGGGQYEYYSVYSGNLKLEAIQERVRLAGKWLWRTFLPDPDYPQYAAQLTKGLTRKQSESIIAKIPWHKRFMKFPPFTRTDPKPKRPGAARRARLTHERTKSECKERKESVALKDPRN